MPSTRRESQTRAWMLALARLLKSRRHSSLDCLVQNARAAHRPLVGGHCPRTCLPWQRSYPRERGGYGGSSTLSTCDPRESRLHFLPPIGWLAGGSYLATGRKSARKLHGKRVSRGGISRATFRTLRSVPRGDRHRRPGHKPARTLPTGNRLALTGRRILTSATPRR